VSYLSDTLAGGMSMTLRLSTLVLGVAGTITISTLAAPSLAHAARKAVCEHPNGGVCVATKDTGRIKCSCESGEHELDNDEIVNADEQGLMDACWDAWSEVCAPWVGETVTCEEPDVGSCELAQESEGGVVTCDCDELGEISDRITGVEDLDSDALEDECHVQLEDLCGPPPASPAMAPPAGPPATFGDSEGGSSLSCSVGTAPQGGVLALILLALGVGRRRR